MKVHMATYTMATKLRQICPPTLQMPRGGPHSNSGSPQGGKDLGGEVGTGVGVGWGGEERAGSSGGMGLGGDGEGRGGRAEMGGSMGRLEMGGAGGIGKLSIGGRGESSLVRGLGNPRLVVL